MFNKIKDIFKRNSIPTINFNPSIKNLTNTSFFNIGYNDRLLEVHSLIYSVVDKKSKAIAQLPLKLYKDDTIKDYKCIIKKKVIVKNNLSYIFDTCPNKYMTPYIFWRTMVAHKEIYGNAYAYIRHNNIIFGYIIGASSFLVDNFLLIGSLGTKLILTYKFPGISILKSLNFFNFVNHLDKLFSFIYLFEYTITLSLIIYIFKDTIKRLKN